MASGLRSILAHPSVYLLAQRLLGGVQGRVWALEALALREGEKLLDVGCGPAYYLGDLPSCEYWGFDTDAGYIEHARRRFGRRGTFFAEPYTDAHREKLPPFDAVMLMGLLHHLSDDEADGLLALVAKSLGPKGRVVALDTVFHDGQSTLARVLAENDRGTFIRRPEGFRALAERHFEAVSGSVLGDTFTVRSSFYLMEMRGPSTDRADAR